MFCSTRVLAKLVWGKKRQMIKRERIFLINIDRSKKAKSIIQIFCAKFYLQFLERIKEVAENYNKNKLVETDYSIQTKYP